MSFNSDLIGEEMLASLAGQVYKHTHKGKAGKAHKGKDQRKISIITIIQVQRYQSLLLNLIMHYYQFIGY